MVFYIRYPGVQTDSCQNKKPGSGTPGPYGRWIGEGKKGEKYKIFLVSRGLQNSRA